jgi:hypothetical protein
MSAPMNAACLMATEWGTGIPLLSGEAVAIGFLAVILLLAYMALAIGVANEAEAKGYNYWDYFLSSFFGNHWGTRAVVHSLPHKSRLSDAPVVGPSGARGKPGAAKKPSTCHSCLSELPDSAKYCGTCGVRQGWDDPAPAPSSRDCPGCGAENSSTANYCSACGTSVKPAVHPGK